MTHSSTRHRRLLPIGELSRASGLTVSALRFYDREGLLIPADVDPVTGYRRYSPCQVRPARLLAGMRRVGVPLAEMATIIGALPDVEVVEDLLSAHLQRLEDGLRDARREVQRMQTLLPGAVTGTWSVEVAAGELAHAVESVRYAIGTDPTFPMLRGVLVEPAEGAVRLVATDRYRLAVAEAPAHLGTDDPGSMSLLPTALVDRLHRGALASDHSDLVRLQLSRTTLRAEFTGGEQVVAACLDLDFPDYRRLLHRTTDAGQRARVPTTIILDALAERPAGREGTDRVVLHPGGVREDGEGVLLDRAFLWEAASAARDGHAVLPLGEEIGPLVFHGPDDALVGMVMPVRPEGHS